MSTTVMVAGNLLDDPELQHGRRGKPSVCKCVAVSRRIQNAVGEWGDEVPTGHNVTVCGTTANHFHDSADRGNRAVGRRQLRSEGWCDRKDGENCSKQVVTVEARFGVVDLALKYGATRLERQIAPAVTTEF